MLQAMIFCCVFWCKKQGIWNKTSNIQFKINWKKYFFTQDVVKLQISVSRGVGDPESLHEFKKGLEIQRSKKKTTTLGSVICTTLMEQRQGNDCPSLLFTALASPVFCPLCLLLQHWTPLYSLPCQGERVAILGRKLHEPQHCSTEQRVVQNCILCKSQVKCKHSGSKALIARST